jgi:hypothetical protein
MLSRFLDQCRVVFSFKNSKGYSIIHTPNDVAWICHYLNTCCEAPESGHKKYVKQQGLKTNQGPEVQLTMMLHSLGKECSAILCEAVQGAFNLSRDKLIYLLFLCYKAKIDDQVPGYEQDDWIRTKKRLEAEKPIRADSWYYKYMDGERERLS